MTSSSRREQATKRIGCLLVFLAALIFRCSFSRAAEPILPEKDPQATGPAVKYLDKVAKQHPRLLITAESLPQIKALYNRPEGKLYHDQLEAFVRGCTVPADRKMGPDWARCQVIGEQKIPSVALHYLLTKDKGSFDKAVAYLRWLAGQADWDNGGEPAVPDTIAEYTKVLDTMKLFEANKERNNSVAAGFTMMGAALTWDWLYNDLDPDFRECFRQILWQHARSMYYGGHLRRDPGGSYWQGKPNCNHRWFRDWGLTFAALGTAEGKPDEQWLLGEVRKELQFNVTWLPADGSQHEGPGYGCSAGALGLALQVSDDITGTHFLDAPFYTNEAAYALQVSTPGFQESFYFADCFDKATSLHPFFLKTAARNHQLDTLDGMRQAIGKAFPKWGIKDLSWIAILCDDPAIKGGDYHKLPTAAFMPDVGVAVVRDSWQDDAIGAFFKCGPYGGYKTNACIHTDKTASLNVAHDHPDANSFSLFAHGDYAAETERYPHGTGHGKCSTGLNTILINGIGQVPQGRPDGEEWSQPGTGDLTQAARMVAYKDAGQVLLAEGEAAGSYLKYDRDGKNRPALDRFRRTFIWVKGGYVLTFDDIRSPQPVDITWLIEGAKLDPVSEKDGRYRLAKGQTQCEFQLICNAAVQSKIGVSTANDHGKPFNWQQLQAAANSAAARFACVLDPWHKNVKVVMTSDGPDKATLKVTGDGINDTWQWTAAKAKFEAPTWHGVRPGGFDLTIDAKTALPPSP